MSHFDAVLVLLHTLSHPLSPTVGRHGAKMRRTPCFQVGLTASTWTVFYVMMLDSMRTHSSTHNRFACTETGFSSSFPTFARTHPFRALQSNFIFLHDFIVCYFREGPNHNISPSSLLLRFACWLPGFFPRYPSPHKTVCARLSESEAPPAHRVPRSDRLRIVC
jgi:hypothetical protein